MPETGSYAEKALVEERNLAPLPDAIDFDRGASIGIAYLTAFRGIKQLCAVRKPLASQILNISLSIFCCKLVTLFFVFTTLSQDFFNVGAYLQSSVQVR